MKCCEIYFFRHAQTEWNLQKRFQGQKNSDLSENGILQSKKMGKKIMSISPDVFITSGLKRTKDTLKYAIEELNIKKETVEMPTFNEASFGLWEGMKISDVIKNYNSVFETHKNYPHLFKMEGAETYLEIQSRALSGINEIINKYPGKKVAVITHGMTILCLLGYIRNIPIKNIREKIAIPENTDFIKICWYR
jgi:probable phosphoglycerate mutase